MPDSPSGRKRRGPEPLDAEQLWEFAVKALGGRALSSAEIRERLRRRAANLADVPATVAKLKEYGYLDDKRMAENFAAARKESRGFGKFRVMRDLQKRRVAPGLARDAVEQAFEGADETAMIEEFLARKYRSSNLGELLRDQKKLASVYGRLRRSGFSSGASIRVLKRYAAQADELEGLEDASAG